MSITRLAPSPTGALHLGNARTFLINWLLARQLGWKIILRIEDLDGPRIKKGADQLAMHDLQWLGLDWDEGPIYQSSRLRHYKAAQQQLIDTKRAYYCVCTRKEVDLAASAPHAEDGATVYPGTCRDRFATMEAAQAYSRRRQPAVRFDTRNQSISFTDLFSGPHHFNVEHQLGDFVIAKSDSTPAYQLAVVVDDADMRITDIVRGDDLLDSTPRQILLYRALNFEQFIPNYYHLPLVIGPDGRRLAKRHGDTRLATYRERCISPQRIVSMLARWSGVSNVADEITPTELLGGFDLANVPRTPIVFDPAQHNL